MRSGQFIPVSADPAAARGDAGLIESWREAEIGPNIPVVLETVWVSDSAVKRERGDWTNAGNCLKSSACRDGSGHRAHLAVHICNM